MREIWQGGYNPDELAWEVIEEIVGQVRATWALDGEREALFAEDRAAFDRYAADDTGQAYADEPGMREREEDWRNWAWGKGIQVYDDGEAGWTYIGTTDEIEEFRDKQDADF
jgi:hypothetical protein